MIRSSSPPESTDTLRGSDSRVSFKSCRWHPFMQSGLVGGKVKSEMQSRKKHGSD
jgi:hypothetical protein